MVAPPRAQASSERLFFRTVHLVSEDSVADTSLALIAGDRARAAEAERERLYKRLGAGAAVVLVHIVTCPAALFTAGKIEALRRLPVAAAESGAADPPLAHHTKTNTAPIPVALVHPARRAAFQAPKFTITVPPKAQDQQQQQKPGSVMEAIGKELACGAGPWEHLSQAEREACKRNPWKFKKTPKGTIVMDVPEKAPPAEEPTSGADQEIHTLQTSDPCLAAGNTHSECIHKTIFGR